LASPLLTDLYQLTMIQAYLDHGKTEAAVFEFFVRKLPPGRSFLMAAGLDTALDYLETLRFPPADLAWLEGSGRFSRALIHHLRNLRFTGDVDAMPEGTAFFANEPILRVVAPLPQAQLVETRLVNILHYQTLIATKAARLKLLAPDKLLYDFGLRRAHGADAGLMAARASYIAGFTGTATLLAEQRFGIPAVGTMAHSFVQAFDDETDAFESFARARPQNLVLLIDTYDTEAGARRVVALAPKLKAAGIKLGAVRIDSGDPAALSRRVRGILDAGGLDEVRILVSGGVDEEVLAACAAHGAPIDGYGIGTSLTTSSDAPALDCAYKLQEYAGVPKRKLSPGKATWPGRKQVWRRDGSDGRMAGDVLSLEDDSVEGEPLLRPVMRAGRRITPRLALAEIRTHAGRELARLPRPPASGQAYPVRIGEALQRLTAEVDRRIAATRPGP